MKIFFKISIHSILCWSLLVNPRNRFFFCQNIFFVLFSDDSRIYQVIECTILLLFSSFFFVETRTHFSISHMSGLFCWSWKLHVLVLHYKLKSTFLLLLLLLFREMKCKMHVDLVIRFCFNLLNVFVAFCTFRLCCCWSRLGD